METKKVHQWTENANSVEVSTGLRNESSQHMGTREKYANSQTSLLMSVTQQRTIKKRNINTRNTKCTALRTNDESENKSK